MGYFLKVPPHSDFKKGIFIPYASIREAETQMANDLLSTDFIEGIVEGNFKMDKRGALEHVADSNGVLWPEHVYTHKRIRTVAEIRKRQSGLLESMRVDAEEAQTKSLLRISWLKEGLAEYGSFDKLPKELREIAQSLGMEPVMIAGRPGFALVTGGTATGGAVALAAATAKTVIGVAAGAVGSPTLAEVAISFDGVTQSAVPVLCEAVSGTNATNPPGTASTTMVAKQIRGWATGGPSSTCAYNWTTEPTVLEVFKKRLLTPAGGLIVLQWPLDREATLVVAAATQFKFSGWRLTAPAAVNVHADMEFDE